jgi:signal peptidase I
MGSDRELRPLTWWALRTARLDRRVRREARLLVHHARKAVTRQPELVELAAASAEVDQALTAGDLARVRRGLPRLDFLVDELARPARSAVLDVLGTVLGVAVTVLAIRAFVVEAFKIPSSSMYPTLEINDHIFVNKFIYGLRVPFTTHKLFERSPARGEVVVFIMPCQPDRDYIKRVVAVAGDTVEVRCNVLYVNGAAVPNRLVDPACEYRDNHETGPWRTEQCSRYVETLGGYDYSTYHDRKRPQRDARLASDGGLTDGDVKDFPRSAIVRSCRSEFAAPGGAFQNQRPGTMRQTKPEPGVLGACVPQLEYVVPDGHVFVMGDNRYNSNDSRYWGSVPIENLKGKALFVFLSYTDWNLTTWGGMRWSRMGQLVH